MDRAIVYFKQLKERNYKYTQFELIRNIRALQRRTRGLTLTDRIAIFEVLTKAKMSYANFRSLIYCTIPGTRVREDEVKYILIWFFKNIKTNPRKCSAILVWISVMLHFELCDKKYVKKFYQQFINAIRVGLQVKHVCKIIYDLTSPADIYRSIVQDFVRFLKKYPKSKPIGAVLSRFKHYRPDLVPEKVPSVSIKTTFSFMMPQEILYNINDMIGKDIADLIPDGQQKRKKWLPHVIPPMLYLRFKHTTHRRSGNYRLYEFDNAQELAANQSVIELPHNVISLIADERGYLVLSCENTSIQTRLSSELEQMFNSVFIANGHMYNPEDKKILLNSVIHFVEFMHSPVPVVSTFLAKYIQIWDGKSYEEEIIKLLPWLSFVTNKVYIQSIQPALKSLFSTIPAEKKCSIISAMGHFIINFVTRSKSQRHTVFGGSVENFLPEEVVSNVATFILNLCADEMFYQDDQYILHASLDFFELVCIISEMYDVPFQIHLPAAIAYRALFSKEATSLTRLCSIFLRLSQLYKESDSVMTNNSIIYTLKMFKDFFECLLSREENKGQNLIFNYDSQHTIFVKKLIMEKDFTGVSNHLAFSLLSLTFDDNLLDPYGTARTVKRECKSIEDFLLYYEKVYVKKKRTRKSSK